MALRYLDINPTPISEEGIYSISIMGVEPSLVEYRCVEGQIDSYVNGSLQNSQQCNTLSNGYIYAIFAGTPIFYNDITKTYTNFAEGDVDISYSTDIMFAVNNINVRIEVYSVSELPIRDFVDYFSSVIYVTSEVVRYIGKKNDKIGLFAMSLTQGENTFTEYNGTKLVNLEEKDITLLKDGDVDVYVIFKVGENLYRYNILDDFVDDNIILWGILPEDIENFSLGAKYDASFNYQEFYLIDFVNHRYYTATLTDTPPTLDSALITFKKKDGTTKTYSAVKFVKKDGTSKTYTKVRFKKVNGGD